MAGAGTQANKVSMPKPSDSLLRGVKLKRWDDVRTNHYAGSIRAPDGRLNLRLALAFVSEGNDSTRVRSESRRVGPRAWCGSRGKGKLEPKLWERHFCVLIVLVGREEFGYQIDCKCLYSLILGFLW